MKTTVAFLALCSLSCASAPGPREARFTTRDGVNIFYRVVGRGEPAVVFVHGGPGGSMADGGHEMEPLATGRTLVLYDQRGSGRSDLISDPSRLNLDANVEDLEQLRAHLGFNRIALIGLSWGAGLATAYASKYGAHVERMVLLSPMAPTRQLSRDRNAHINDVLGPDRIAQRRANNQKRATASDAELVELCREFFRIMEPVYVKHPERVAPERGDRCPSADVIRNARVVLDSTWASLGEFDFRPALSKLTMQVLVIEGADTNVPLDATRVWAASAPNARLLLIPDAGHMNWRDQPEAFRKAVDEFLRGQ